MLNIKLMIATDVPHLREITVEYCIPDSLHCYRNYLYSIARKELELVTVSRCGTSTRRNRSFTASRGDYPRSAKQASSRGRRASRERCSA